MPVYEQHYRLWRGRRRPRWLRWTVITRYHLRQLFGGKGRLPLIALLVLSGIFYLGCLAIIYILSNPELHKLLGPNFNLPKITPNFFLWAIVPQCFTIGLFTLIVGSGLIADDRRDNAIPLYLSKPLTPGEYIFGKFSVLAVFILGTTAVPLNVLFVFEVLMHGGRTFLKTYWWLPFSITAYSLVLTVFCGAVILLASSLVKKAALAGVLVIGLFFVNNILAGMCAGIFQNDKWTVLSLQYDLVGIGFWLFRIREIALPSSGPTAAAMIFGTVVTCFAIVRWRIRPVEVVK